MNNNCKAYFFTRFQRTLKAGGGSRRLIQLLEALGGFDLQIYSSAEEKERQSVMQRLRGIFGSGDVVNAMSGWNDGHASYAKTLWAQAEVWTKTFQAEEYRIALVDDPIYFEPILRALKSQSLKVVAVCHNIESLSAQQVAAGYQRALFNHELDLLGECDLAITISREEYVLLHNLGINSIYFPYYPVAEIRQSLTEIRADRQRTQKQDILMIGTAKNKATRQGMELAIKNWQEKNLSRPGRELLVAGYGTEGLASYGSEGVRILGPIADDALDALLRSVKACLCYQESASGALTRIAEMLCAAVPVLANSLAARSYYNLPGLYEFSDFDDFERVLKNLDEQPVEVPEFSPPDANILQHAIETLTREA